MIIKKYFFLLSALTFLTDLHASEIPAASQATTKEQFKDLGPSDKYAHLNYSFLELGNTEWNEKAFETFELKKAYEAQQTQLLAQRKAVKSPTENKQ